MSQQLYPSKKLLNLYVVSYQAYVYGDDCGKWDGEIKYALTENFEVRGVFPSLRDANMYVNDMAEQWACNMADDEEEQRREAKHEKEWHYSVEKFALGVPKP